MSTCRYWVWLLLLVTALPAYAQNALAIPSQADLSTAQKGEVWDQAIHILGGNANVISRWSAPVRFALISDDSDGVVARHMSSVFHEVSALTGLQVSEAPSRYDSPAEYKDGLSALKPYQLYPCDQGVGCANFLVVVSSVNTMRKIAGLIRLRDVYQKALQNESAVVCFFAPFQGASVIRQAVVFVRDDLPVKMTQTCLQEEIYQSFGLFNDYTDSLYFSFNNRVEPKQITSYDKALLQAVYEFSPGSPAFLVAKRLMSNLERITSK